jgi:hypothetical protein
MGYRIHIGIIKKKELEAHLLKTFPDTDDGNADKEEFFDNSRDTELNDSVVIDCFKPVKGYEDEEYPPYLLDKKDFQKILDYYKEFICKNATEKEELLKTGKLKKTDRELANVSMHFYYIQSYFDGLIKRKENIQSSGLFFIDYFYLVRMFENWKNGDRALITHG